MEGAMTRRRVLAAVLLTGLAAAAQTPFKERREPVPEVLDVGLDPKIGASLPLDAVFRDELGRERKLRDFFDGERPVLITLNYFRCPMLCTYQLNALVTGGETARAEGRVSGLKGLDLEPGRDFLLLTVSFDPLEGPPLARLKKQNYLNLYGRAGAAEGWFFLTGKPASIRALTEAVGFRYKLNTNRGNGEYSHPPVVVVCTPDGKVNEYLTGIVYETKDLRAALQRASRREPTKGLLHYVLITCCRYDPQADSYAVDAMRIMRTGGILTALAVGFLLLRLRRQHRRGSGR